MHFNQRQRYNNFENPSAVLHNFHDFYSNISVASCWYLTRTCCPLFRGIPTSSFYLPVSVPRLAIPRIPTPFCHRVTGICFVKRGRKILNNIFQPHLKNQLLCLFLSAQFFTTLQKIDIQLKQMERQNILTVSDTKLLGPLSFVIEIED